MQCLREQRITGLLPRPVAPVLDNLACPANLPNDFGAAVPVVLHNFRDWSLRIGCETRLEGFAQWDGPPAGISARPTGKTGGPDRNYQFDAVGNSPGDLTFDRMCPGAHALLW